MSIRHIRKLALLALMSTVQLLASSEGDAQSNIFFGYEAGESLDSSSQSNSHIGYRAGKFDENGKYNTYVGFESGYTQNFGYNNTFIGAQSGYRFTLRSEIPITSGGHDNTFNGYQAGYSNKDGSENTFTGSQSGYTNTLGNQNAFFGFGTGYNADINGSVFLGYKAGYNALENNRLYIANSDTDSPLIYGEFDTNLVRVNGDFEFTGIMNAPLLVNDLIEAVGIEIADTSGAIISANNKGVTIEQNDYSNNNVKQLLKLANENENDDKASDVAILLENLRQDFAWQMCTLQNKTGFSITKKGSGSKEVIITGADSPNGMEFILANGAKNSGGQWLDASSRAYKENIKILDTQAAMKAFEILQPVTYNYKTNKEESIVGFIAEDVPELIAVKGRNALSALEVVALLTKVVQEQEKVLKAKDIEINKMKSTQKELETKYNSLTNELTSLKTMQERLSRLETILGHQVFENVCSPSKNHKTLSLNHP